MRNFNKVKKKYDIIFSPLVLCHDHTIWVEECATSHKLMVKIDKCTQQSVGWTWGRRRKVHSCGLLKQTFSIFFLPWHFPSSYFLFSHLLGKVENIFICIIFLTFLFISPYLVSCCCRTLSLFFFMLLLFLSFFFDVFLLFCFILFCEVKKLLRSLLTLVKALKSFFYF